MSSSSSSRSGSNPLPLLKKYVIIQKILVLKKRQGKVGRTQLWVVHPVRGQPWFLHYEPTTSSITTHPYP